MGMQVFRGRADQTQVSYLLLAPLVIAGEQSPDEAAVRERGLELLFSKKDIHAADTREAFLALTARPENLTSLGRRLLGEALDLLIDEVAAWHRESLNLFAPGLPSRIRSNLAAVMCGLRLLDRVCRRLDLTWDQVFPISLEECARFLGFGVQEYLLDGGESNKTIVEQTLEVFDRMKLGAELVHLSEDGSELALYIKDIYDLFTQYVKDHCCRWRAADEAGIHPSAEAGGVLPGLENCTFFRSCQTGAHLELQGFADPLRCHRLWRHDSFPL